MSTPQVYIVDDDEAVRRSLSWLLESVDVVARVYSSAMDFLEEFDAEAPGCLILDVRMPNIGGVELHRIIRQRAPALSTIFITAHGDVPMSVRAMKAGAFDFLEKPFNYQMMIDLVLAGVARSSELLEARRARQTFEDRLNVLSMRERDVLRLMADGKLIKQIAHDLGISAKTVDIHRANIKRKLGTESITRIIALMNQRVGRSKDSRIP